MQTPAHTHDAGHVRALSTPCMAAHAVVPPLDRAPWALKQPQTVVTHPTIKYDDGSESIRKQKYRNTRMDECPRELASAVFGPRSLLGETSGGPRCPFKPLRDEAGGLTDTQVLSCC